LITALANPHLKNYLIGTSDVWLPFIVRHRAQLERYFNVLQAPNEALDLCINKNKFYQWCEAHGFSVPRTLFGINHDTWHTIEQHIPFPLLVKLSNKGLRQDISFPKTLEIQTSKQLEQLRQQAFALNFVDELMISESLLNRRLIQFSLPFCCNGEGIISYEAIKERPAPQQCGVGTFVSTCHHPHLKEMCHQLLKKLNYYGFGELEVLYDQDQQQYFIIELNARPWTQMTLATAIGYNFLRFLLYKEEQHPPPAREGLAWLSFTEDLYHSYAALKKQPSCKTIISYLLSLKRTRAFDYFSLADPFPATRETFIFFKEWFRNHIFLKP
jgi:D-aspartate ligase